MRGLLYCTLPVVDRGDSCVFFLPGSDASVVWWHGDGAIWYGFGAVLYTWPDGQ